ncbi:MAG: dihydrodipicolinate synthase family protein [Alphaproteobacteria bacterium]|nr:dihydrodipicolinate synthase family protein [Alphaproteobacteria bacterium]
MHKINGIYSAALTPINDDLSINKNLYLEHCQYLMKQGHDGLAIFGTTGEANSFSIKEKCDTIDFLLSNNLDSNLLIPGTGSSSVEDAIQLTKFAEKNKSRAVLLLPPFYYKNVSDEGIINYFRKIIETVGSSDFHYLLYNIPQTTSVVLNFNIIETLLKLYPNNIVGIKDSSGNIDSMLKTVKYFQDLALFCGHDSLVLKVCKRGGAGAITAGTNIAGRLLSFIINNINKEKEIEDFNSYQALLEKIRETITLEEPISVMKAYFSIINKNPEWNKVMPPLKSLDNPSNSKTIIRLIELTNKMDELIPSS